MKENITIGNHPGFIVNYNRAVKYLSAVLFLSAFIAFSDLSAKTIDAANLNSLPAYNVAQNADNNASHEANAGQIKTEGNANTDATPAVTEKNQPEETGGSEAETDIKKTTESADSNTKNKPSAEENKTGTLNIKNNTAAVKAVPANSILEIDDPGLRDIRIPGISIKKEKKIIESIEDPKIISDSKDQASEKKGKGFFGSVSNIIVEIIVILLIIGIIVLFKFRSKSRGGSSKVLRRFPGA